MPCGFLATTVVMPLVKGGKLNALGVTASKRLLSAPNVPTIAEAGVPGYEASFGEMLLVPKGTPDAVVKRLNETIGKILQLPEVRDRMMAAELEFAPNSPAEASAHVRREMQKWPAIIDRLGLQLD